MSMTREEATELLRYRRNLISSVDMDWCANETEALDLALSALLPVSREQVGRMRGEWRSIHGLSEYYCSRCGEEFEIRAYDKEKYRFCPHCMAPMTDEAVEMAVKRLEALYEEN